MTAATPFEPPFPHQARAEAVQVMDKAAGTPGSVHLSDGSMLEYDYLVMALGSEADSRGVPGVMEYAVPFNNFEDAVKVGANTTLWAIWHLSRLAACVSGCSALLTALLTFVYSFICTLFFQKLQELGGFVLCLCYVTSV